MKYDYVIVGAGLFGAVFAHEMKKREKSCLVIEKRQHVGGNVYSEAYGKIEIHRYGPHIFHTSSEKVWKYITNVTPFIPFVYEPVARYKNELYNLPFNMNTFYQMWRVKTPAEAKQKLCEQQGKYSDLIPKNLEEQALKLVGHDIYYKLIKGYTEKQWGCNARLLPAFIIKRLPVRFTYDNNYFNDKYQGIPEFGYTQLINNLLIGTKVIIGENFLDKSVEWSKLGRKIMFTGPIDQFFQCCFGALEYRSLRFEDEILDLENWQGAAVVNYTNREIPYTRSIEHKHFFKDLDTAYTVITREYPQAWDLTKEPFYPVNNEKNNIIYNKYRDLANHKENLLFGGRLGEYQYYNMDQVIDKALHAVETEMQDGFS